MYGFSALFGDRRGRRRRDVDAEAWTVTFAVSRQLSDAAERNIERQWRDAAGGWRVELRYTPPPRAGHPDGEVDRLTRRFCATHGVKRTEPPRLRRA